MKYYMMLGAAMTVLAIQPATAEMHEGHGQKDKQPQMKMFEMFDTDNDGMISKQEFLAEHEERFADIDNNNDGALSPEEVRAKAKEWREKMKERREKIQKMREQQSGDSAE